MSDADKLIKKIEQEKAERESSIAELEADLKNVATKAEKLKLSYSGFPKPDSEYSEPAALVKKLGQCAELLNNLKSYKTA